MIQKFYYIPKKPLKEKKIQGFGWKEKNLY